MRSLAPSLTLLLGTTGMSLVAACLLLPAPAHGFTMQDHAGMADASHDGHTLAGMDSDHDGRISRTEFAAAHDGKSERFAGIDSNGDGFISQAEFDAHHAAMKPAKDGSEANPTEAEHACHH